MKIKRYSNTKAQKTERWNDRKIQRYKDTKKKTKIPWYIKIQYTNIQRKQDTMIKIQNARYLDKKIQRVKGKRYKDTKIKR